MKDKYKLSRRTIKDIVHLTHGTSSNSYKADYLVYRTGNELVALFNSFVRSEGLGGLSRAPYTELMVKEVIKVGKLVNLLNDLADKRNFLNDTLHGKFLNELNTSLSYDGYKLIPRGKSYILSEIEDCVVNSVGAELKNSMEKLITFQTDLVEMVRENKRDKLESYKGVYIRERNSLLKDFGTKVPQFLRDCRTYDALISFLIDLDTDKNTWKQSARSYINKQFNRFLNVVEFGEKIAHIDDNEVTLILNPKVFAHIESLLINKEYFNAVEEAYKFVRAELKEITGKERATDAFNRANYKKIFGHDPSNAVEKDFYEGVKFLHMAIQFLRNEKSHTPRTSLDQNLAVHYIGLASLAYDLITKNKND